MTIKMPHIVKPGNDDRAEAFIAGAFKAPVREAAQDDGPGKSVANMRFDAKLLVRRKAFPNAFSSGLSVLEQERKDPKAVDEILSVVDALYAQEAGNDYQDAAHRKAG